MTTEETAKLTKTEYFIEYVYPIDAYGHQEFYFQLVRKSDLAILQANKDIRDVMIRCWELAIPKEQVTIW